MYEHRSLISSSTSHSTHISGKVIPMKCRNQIRYLVPVPGTIRSPALIHTEPRPDIYYLVYILILVTEVKSLRGVVACRMRCVDAYGGMAWRYGHNRTIPPSESSMPHCRYACFAFGKHVACLSVSQACRMRPGVCLFEVEPCLLAILALFVCTRS